MTGTPLETLPRLTLFGTSCCTLSMPSPRTRSRGRVMDAVPDGTSSRVSRLASCTGCAAMKSRFSPSLTAGDDQATGGPDYERPSNFGVQRTRGPSAARR